MPGVARCGIWCHRQVSSARHPLLAVIGACGGAGASVFCAALVMACTRPPPVLLDLDATGGGIDLLLGIEGKPGARWADLRLGGGDLDPGQLRARLPSWGGASVLAAAGRAAPSAAEVGQVLAAARSARPVVVDVPRWSPACADPALAQADAAVIVVAAEVRCVVAAARLIDDLKRDWPDGAGRRIAAVVRPGAVAFGAVRKHLDPSLAVTLPVHDWLGGDDGGALQDADLPRPLADVARRVWDWARPS